MIEVEIDATGLPMHEDPYGLLADRDALDRVLADLPPAAVKTGMLANPDIVKAVADLADRGLLPSLVVDPVLVSTSGHLLMEAGGVEAYRSLLDAEGPTVFVGRTVLHYASPARAVASQRNCAASRKVASSSSCAIPASASRRTICRA